MGCGRSTAKYVLFFVNILIFILSVVIVAAGGILSSRLSETWLHMDYFPKEPIYLALIVGTGALLISFFGCCGAIRESPCFLVTYAVTITILLITEFVAAGLLFHYRNNIAHEIKNEIKRLMSAYGDGTIVTGSQIAIDALQNYLHCCGMWESEEWLKQKDYKNGYPASCCDGFDTKNRTAECEHPYQKSCLKELETYFYYYANFAAYGGIVIALVQLTAIIAACLLAKAFRRKHLYLKGY